MIFDTYEASEAPDTSEEYEAFDTFELPHHRYHVFCQYQSANPPCRKDSYCFEVVGNVPDLLQHGKPARRYRVL